MHKFVWFKVLWIKEFFSGFAVPTPRKKFYLNSKYRFFNFISLIWSKNTFGTNINLFDLEKYFSIQILYWQKIINNLLNLIIFERRQFSLWIKDNISVSLITNVQYDCTDIYFFKKKQSRNFFELKKLFFDCTSMIFLFLSVQYLHSEKVSFKFKKSFFNLISLIRSKNNFKTNIY